MSAIVALICMTQRAEAEELRPAGPYAASLASGIEIGVVSVTHGKLGIALGRTFWDRLDVEATVRVGAADDLLVHEEAIRAGAVFRLVHRLSLFMGGRVGVASFRYRLPGGTVHPTTLSLGLGPEIRYLLSPRLELRAAPVAPIAYVNDFWSLAIAVEAGMAYRFP